MMRVQYLLILLILPLIQSQYLVSDEARYLANFNIHMSASYKEPIPTNLKNACASKGKFIITQNVTITSSITAQELGARCGINTRCIIQSGVTIKMNADLNVGVLEIAGTLEWTDSTQVNMEQYLCAGYILFSPLSVCNIQLSQKKGYIYIKNNGAFHLQYGMRFLVAERTARFGMAGREMRRTWSLLSEDFKIGESKITLVHSAADMGWRVGDRVSIAPTTYRSLGNTQHFFIKSISENVVQLAADIGLTIVGSANQNYGGNPGGVQGEVINLARNFLITGDDFENIPCGTNGCNCDATIPRTMCTVGLHTMFQGSATYSVKNIKVEKCGQRGILARYCMHFHQSQECDNCLIHGNVIEHSHQRGIVIHGTHLVTVSHNILYDVRGAGIYIEDGNELFNNIEYNVVICPFEFTGIQQGCTIPGTDNREADTSQNQAAIWALSHTNNFVGNRASNTFNGLHFHPSFQNNGRGLVEGHVCARFTPLGRVIGNTLHGHGRFGTYFVESNWPRHVPGISIASNGITGMDCSAFDINGYDLGYSATIVDNVDYHNQFVGSYAMGDIQFHRHTSFDSSNILYSKDTKNFADGCSPHYKDTTFQGPGIMQLADGAATIIFENVSFKGDMTFQANHHCGIGITGLLCNPVYMFQKHTWDVTSTKWVTFYEADVSGDPSKDENWSHGGIFVLSPDDIPNTAANFFPAGYVSLCSGAFTYLLNLEGGQLCTKASTLGLGERYDNGILCKKTLRRLNIYSDSYAETDRGVTIKLEVFKNNVKVTQASMPFQWTTIRKQGFTIPVIPDLSFDYTVSKMDGSGIPATWIIEFSDTVIGNRWTPDQIKLKVTGRTCPAITTSQHDRRFIWGDSLDYNLQVRDRGACTSYPNMPAVSCATKPVLDSVSCPDKCSENCKAKNAYCDCGSQQCRCEAGFYGPNCQYDICNDTRCLNGGKCAARYLGGDLRVMRGACICKEPYLGANCESNPCAGVTCNGHGKCKATGPNSYKCECNAPYTGIQCTDSCEGKCVGTYPYMCSMIETFSYCIKGVNLGCDYQNRTGQSAYCCVKNCYPCEKMTCPYSQNDCYESNGCSNGACLPFKMRLDGSVCHSKSFGVCIQGTCMEGKAQQITASEEETTQTSSTFDSTQSSNTQSGNTQTDSTQDSTQSSNTQADSTQKDSTKSSSTKSDSTKTDITKEDSSQITTQSDASTSNDTAATNGTYIDDNNVKENKMETWKLSLIIGGSVLGAAIIVFILIVVLAPNVRSKIFIKKISDVVNGEKRSSVELTQVVNTSAQKVVNPLINIRKSQNL